MTARDTGAEERLGARRCFRCQRRSYHTTPLFGGESHLCTCCAWCHQLETDYRQGWRRRLRPAIKLLVATVDRVRGTFTQPTEH